MRIEGAKRFWYGVLCAILVGCGGAATTQTRAEGDGTSGGEEEEELEDAGPEPVCNLAETPIGDYRMPALPDGFDMLDPAHREAFEAAQAVLSRRAPAAPEDLSTASVQAWADGPWSTWLAETRTAMDAAEQRLNALAEGPEPVRVVASTLVGLMYVHLADETLAAPIPADIAADAELRSVFVSAIRRGVEPLLETSIDRAEYCVLTAQRQQPALDRWRIYCYSLIGHAVVEEDGVASIIRASDAEAASPEYIERHYGASTPGARVVPGTPVVEGALAPEAVQSFLEAQQRPLVACYQRGLAEESDLAGQAVMRFRVARTGATSQVTTQFHTLSRPEVAQCLVTAIDALTFPAPTTGEATVQVALDLRMVPVAAAPAAPAAAAPAAATPAPAQ